MGGRAVEGAGLDRIPSFVGSNPTPSARRKKLYRIRNLMLYSMRMVVITIKGVF